MPDIRLFSSVSSLLALLLLTSCSQPQVSPRQVQVQQQWQLQPGDTLAGHKIMGGLGDISIALNGSSIKAPFDGQVQPYSADCVMFSSPEVPAYLLRLCGLNRPRLGDIQQGEAIGSGRFLQFAALRRQPDGKWAMVEPSTTLLERTLR